jgi:hypothetical protein
MISSLKIKEIKYRLIARSAHKISKIALNPPSSIAGDQMLKTLLIHLN